MAEIFLKLIKSISPQIKEVLQTPKTMNKEIMTKHVIIKLFRTNNKERILAAVIAKRQDLEGQK